MAKSKEQKQLEALQRKRAGIDGWRVWCMERNTSDARRHFEKLCKEAQVDTHGNPLPGSPGYNDPGLLLDPKATVTVRVKGLYTERVVGSHRHEPILSSGSFDQIKYNIDEV